MAVDPGTRIGPYEVVSLLGAGGMGEVYLARDQRLKRDVALKLLPLDLTSDAERLRRFEQEAQSASALNHPNIITVHDAGSCEAGRYLVMERVVGRTLRHVMRDGLTVPAVLKLGRQMAEALSAAHAAGITHRDVKPDNVMVRDDGYLKVLDFGLARLRPGTAADDTATRIQHTALGTLIGTVAYMSPEQARGNPAGPESDVFSLGIILYEMASGRHPFPSDSLVGYLHAITGDTPAPLSDVVTGVPPSLSDLVRRMLDKEAQRRPTAREVALMLQDLEHGATGGDASAAARSSSSPVPDANTASVVVMPFSNISADPDNQYFCDGLTDELIADLSKVRSLRVISRNSAMRLRDSKRDLRTIAADLGVRYVLDGSVRKSGQSVRIAVQLIDGPSDANLWSGKYRGTLDDIFEIQESVSGAIVEALEITLSTEERRQLAERPIADPRAYDLYLRARAQLPRAIAPALDRSIELLKQGLALIGDNELLHAALGYSYYAYFRWISKLDEDYLRLAKAHMNRAFAVNPASSHGFSLQGLLRFAEGDIAGSIASLGRAVALDPGNTEALLWLAANSAYVGRCEDSKAYADRLLLIDPLSPINTLVRGVAHGYQGEFDEAWRWTERALAMDPASPLLLWSAAAVGVWSGRINAGIAAIDTLARIAPDWVYTQQALFLKHALRGDKDAALRYNSPVLTAEARHDCHFALHLAHGFALIGEPETALDFLELSVRTGMVNVPFLATFDPLLARLRPEARFQALLREAQQRFEAMSGTAHRPQVDPS